MMNLKKQKLFALTLATAATLAFSGCGASGAGSSTSGAETNAGAAASENTEGASDSATSTGVDSSLSGSAQDEDSSLFKNMETVDLDGNTVDSSIFAENKLTLLNVWNLGCTACIMETPILDQLNNDPAEKGVAIKGLYYNFGTELSDKDRAEIEKILKDANADYQQLLTSKAMDESDTFQNLDAFPTTYFVDSEGNIVKSIAGSDDYEGWKSAIENVLNQVESND